MERGIQLFAAINFLVMGLSHILQHEAWKAFFTTLRDRGVTGNFLNAMLALAMGSFIVAFHNVWSGIPLLLTLYGWAAVAKGALYLIVPQFGQRSLEHATRKDSRLFIVPGVVLVALGAALLYGVVTGG